MTLERKRQIMTVIKYVVLILVGVIMIYPLVWMVGASFKTNAEIFSGIGFIPKHPTTQGYIIGVKNADAILLSSLLFSFAYVMLSFIAPDHFGPSMFMLLMATLFLPNVVLNVPQFIMYNKWGWVDSPLYLPLIVPTLFAQDTYFVFMLIQFLRNIPKELDEAAKIDGCSALGTLWHVIVPVLKPAMTSAALFQFMWSSNDFMGPLLYVSTPKRYPAASFVKMSMDADTGFSWNRILALSLISIIPSLVVFFLAQDQFIDGVTAGSVKG